ncbi:MAG: glycosyltransferase [Flavobacteriaceae bacterium]|nr:glycosyltransferase [Flavobacteriaceae bacterium]
MKRIIVSVTNDLVTDQRVYKVCKTLQELNYDILLIGRKLRDSPPIKRPYKTHRMRLVFNKGFLFYAEYNLRLFFKLLFSKKTILLANDLDTLLPNYLISKIQNKKLVFDSHELFSETPSVQGRYSQKIWRYLERKLVSKQNYMFVVSNSIAVWFENAYGVKSKVLKNLPTHKNVNFMNIEDKYILYQGALNRGRGLFVLIESMQYVENISLKIAGDGPLKTQIEEKIIEYNVQDKVEMLGNILPERLVEITQKATIGVSLEEDLGLSYRYSLPNKLFDYIQAKTPVLGTYLPETKNIIKTYGVGEVINSHSPKDIVYAINVMLEKGKPSFKDNLEIAAKELVWENQKEILLNVFRGIEVADI